jgi:RHS repeat-associated protein
MRLIRGYEIDTNCDDITPTWAREFRYDGDRARYAVIERDPDDMEPTGATWHEYVGDNVYKDLSISPTTGAVTVAASYAHGYSLASMALDPGGQSPARTYFHGDMLGTTRLITNFSAAPIQSPAFTAFGEPLPLPAAGGPVSQPNLGTRYAYVGGWGYQNDGAAAASRDIGMLHVGARYYDPAIGRFLMRDPIGIAGGLNVYAYAGNSPTSRIDPNGLFSYVELGGVLSIIGTLVYDGFRAEGWSPTGGNQFLDSMIDTAVNAVGLKGLKVTCRLVRRVGPRAITAAQNAYNTFSQIPRRVTPEQYRQIVDQIIRDLFP